MHVDDPPLVTLVGVQEIEPPVPAVAVMVYCDGCCPSWVTVNVCPAMVIVPVSWVVAVLAATL
ncbi:hypothetical protein MBAV_001598 [Candidatus Magnetobacterium bavaricum]|uniref:Uncharacterized protein n=1 Tax=Candidatus Magnetobacterium bavaricum TaxID=29290 RepID=A0A0F3GW54_9BACT|nr:hypothetical protein MBAV_001598 [Candidatus Magnetobacterium bavaricum]